MATTEKPEIVINERWKIVKHDRYNWQPYEYKKIRERSNTTRGGETDWIASGHFFGQLQYALMWVADMSLDDEVTRLELQTAVNAIEASNKQLAKSITAALKKYGGEL